MAKHRKSEPLKRKIKEDSDLPKSVEELEHLADEQAKNAKFNREIMLTGGDSSGQIQGPHIT